MTFSLTYDAHLVTLTLEHDSGFFSRLTARTKAYDLDRLPPEQRELIYAVADLRALAEENGEPLEIRGQQIQMSHRLVAALPSQAARALALPPIVDLAFRTDAEGVIGSPSFRLRHEWIKAGQRQLPKRVGAIMETSDGLRRIPLWLLEAVEVAENFRPGGRDDSAHWEALARFRQSLDPGVRVTTSDDAAKISMTDFLSGLSVNLADRFSISPNADGTDFDVVPFSGKRLRLDGLEDSGNPFENQGELEGEALRDFQRRVRERGALPAYRTSPGTYLVIDSSAAPALQVMAKMQGASADQRRAFIRNPRPAITEAVTAALQASGKLDGLDAAGEEEAIESIAGPALVETREYSERVIGIKVFERRTNPSDQGSTTWLPEELASKLSEKLREMSVEQLDALRNSVGAAIEAKQPNVELGNLSLPARDELVTTIDAHISAHRKPQDDLGADEPDSGEPTPRGPIVVSSKDNTEELAWVARFRGRHTSVATKVPTRVRTPLMPHQIESFHWQTNAWKSGLPGILNADEQGLGKTLQTISMLAWLQDHMNETPGARRLPILIVAPTSLLVNWEQEVSGHLHEPGLGRVIRLYGAGTSTRKHVGATGTDIDDGTAKLDLEALHEAIQDGRAHRQWILTTYTTLTNYQHSLAQVPFAATVFDEIQALKNPDSMRAIAALAVNANFVIGLTGTPIENAARDLWAIMEQIAPGALNTRVNFQKSYSTPTAESMAELHNHVFRPRGSFPPLALRRLKQSVASGLPAKTRQLHPRSMPPQQAVVYEDAKLKLAQGGPGAALKMLHHIRSVSVHPGLDPSSTDTDLIAASARLRATFEIIRRIAQAKERALVFIEHRQMQYRFVELVKAEFGLPQIDLINGDTPINKRQTIVNRFQKYGASPGFDLLVLGPKAAGTGLTLTSATHVIHLSRWWNPAVEEQCNDRVHRIGQTRPVSVHIPMAIHPDYREHSFDCLLQSLMQRKRRLASSALWPMGDTEEDAGELQRMVTEAKGEGSGDPITTAMTAMFARDGLALPTQASDGSFLYD